MRRVDTQERGAPQPQRGAATDHRQEAAGWRRARWCRRRQPPCTTNWPCLLHIPNFKKMQQKVLPKIICALRKNLPCTDSSRAKSSAVDVSSGITCFLGRKYVRERSDLADPSCNSQSNLASAKIILENQSINHHPTCRPPARPRRVPCALLTPLHKI